MSYNVVNILDLIEMLGEAPVQAALSDFSCVNLQSKCNK